MRAVVYDAYGPLERLHLGEVPRPEAPPGGLLVRVTRAALNPKDAVVRKGKFRALTGSSFPKLCGADFAGVVEESRSPRLRPGQRVFGFLEEVRYGRGTLAEFVACREREVAALPDGVPDEAGAAVALAGSTALQALRDIGGVGPDSRVLVNGASGGVGTLAVQIARALGATEVHSTSSAKNLELCRRLGATTAWDHAAPDLARARPRCDVVFDVFGNLSLRAARAFLGPRGVYVNTVPSARRLVLDVVTRLAGVSERLVLVRPRPADLNLLGAWLSEGRLEAVIDSRHAMAHVHEAFRVLESKHARGKIVVEVG